MDAKLHITVGGLVQGVGFRWYIARKAEALGLSGFVMNLVDGSVEVEAEGDRSLLEHFLDDVKVGPRSAHVTNLKLEWRSPTFTSKHFEIR